MTTSVLERRQGVAILGSTGSIGVSTLDVMARHPDRFQAIALTAYSRMDELAAQCRRFRPRMAVVPTLEAAQRLKRALGEDWPDLEIAVGVQALCDAVTGEDVDQVMAAIVGAAGLAPCLAAASAGKRLLLANKEALVVGGDVFMGAVRRAGATLMPIDSEHSAIFQCLPVDRSQWSRFIDHIVLTASGGPFRTRDLGTFEAITPAQAVAHPNWQMGRKISVDSATMMNKALEIIEARWLFDLEPQQIRVVIHPQSVIHSMVVCRDASVLAQLGTPDMRVPIAYGLSFPDRIAAGAAPLDFTQPSALSFEPPDPQRFPGLALADEILRGPPGGGVIVNAANEVAVEAFLSQRINFPEIHRVNVDTLQTLMGRHEAPKSLGDLMQLDDQARQVALGVVRRLES